MEIGWTDVVSGGYILVSCAHSNTSYLFDLHLNIFFSRFIINIPEEERQDLIRVFFQIELAHWFYLDFYCAENAELKTCGIKDFSAQDILFICPSLFLLFVCQ